MILIRFSLQTLPYRAANAAGSMLRAALALALLVSWASSASAHSFDRGFASARYIAEVDSDGLWLAVVVEMPTLDVLGDFRRFLRDHPDASDEENTERFRRQQLEDVAAAFELRLNGKPVLGSWKPVAGEANGKGDSDFFLYMVEFRGEITDGQLDVELINSLMPEKVVYMSSQASAENPWQVQEDSAVPLLADGLDGEVVGPDVAAEASGKWTTQEALRRLHLVFSRESLQSTGASPPPSE